MVWNPLANSELAVQLLSVIVKYFERRLDKNKI